MFKYRKLLVHGVNAALANGVLLFDTDTAAGHQLTEVAGFPAVILWGSSSSGSQRISIWWDYHHHRNPYAMPESQHCGPHWQVCPFLPRSVLQPKATLSFSGEGCGIRSIG